MQARNNRYLKGGSAARLALAPGGQSRQVMSEITLTGWDVLDEARAMLRAAVAGVPADGWQRPTPCSEWNVTQVLQHAALDQEVWEAVVAGTETSGENPFAPSGQLGTEPLAYAEAALDASTQAWTAIDGDAGLVPTPLPQGAMAPAAAAGAAALDAAIHAWDIAVATGQPSPLIEELSRALLKSRPKSWSRSGRSRSDRRSRPLRATTTASRC